MSSVDVPKQQNAAVKVGEGKETKIQVTQIDVPIPDSNQILVKINWSGVCASDKSLLFDEMKAFGSVMRPEAKGIAGHEGAGVVVAVGDNMRHRWKVGDRAGIKWVASICGECEFCTNGTDEIHCINQKNSGFTTPGTFQQYVASDGRYTTRIPDGVSDEEAATIMCGGITAYTACKRSAVKPGQWIVIPGAGGGLGHFAVQYAKAMGMRVIAIDGGDEKRDLCKNLGAEEFIDFQQCNDIPAEVVRITTYGAHGVLCTAASKEAYAMSPMLLRPGGTMVAVGIPPDPTVIAGAHPALMVIRRLNVVGSVVGTLKEVAEALDFTARGLVHPILTKGVLEDVDKYCHMMMDGKLAGRAVLKIN